MELISSQSVEINQLQQEYHKHIISKWILEYKPLMFDMPSANISWATYWKWFCSEDQADKKEIPFNIKLIIYSSHLYAR